MKQKFLSLLIVGIIFALTNIVLAESYTYKVHNPLLNKTYTAVFGTMSLTNTQYILGFFTQNGQPLCVANINTNTDKNGLIGGQCTEINAFIKFLNGENIDINSPKYTMGYRELKPNTFYREMNEIQRERAAQGKHLYGANKDNNTQAKSNSSLRYKAGQSDKEICIRNYGGVYACQDASYNKVVANTIKNGGCIASIPDMGYMYKDLKFCQNNPNKVHVLYLPTGETKLVRPMDEYNLAAKPPMTDKEYKEELQEYYNTNR